LGLRLNIYSDSVGPVRAGAIGLNHNRSSSRELERFVAVQKLTAVYPHAIHSIMMTAPGRSRLERRGASFRRTCVWGGGSK
jgi:hypothetical protein